MKTEMKLTNLLPLLNDTLSKTLVDTVKQNDLIPETVDVKRTAGARDIVDLEEGSRTAVQYFTTRTLDRDGDILMPGGAVMDQFKKSNMQVFWNHDYTQLIGSDTAVKRDEFGWMAWTQYAEHEDKSARANIVWELKQQGHLKTNSVGFGILAYLRPNHDQWKAAVDKMQAEWQEFTRKTAADTQRIITRYMVIEHSDVGVASNIDSNMIAIAKNYAPDVEIEKMFGIELAGAPAGDPSVIKDAEKAAAKEAKDDPNPRYKTGKKKPDVRKLPTVKKYVPTVRLVKSAPDAKAIAAEVAAHVKLELDLKSGKV